MSLLPPALPPALPPVLPPALPPDFHPALPPSWYDRLYDAAREGALDKFVRQYAQAEHALLNLPRTCCSSSSPPPSLLLERPSPHHHGRTLLVHACYYNKGKVAKFLLDQKGAHIEAMTHTGRE